MKLDQGFGIALWFLGWTSVFAAQCVRWSAFITLRRRGIRVAGLHSLRRGLDVKKLEVLYEAEFPRGWKLNVSSYLNGFGWSLLLCGTLIFVFGRKSS